MVINLGDAGSGSGLQGDLRYAVNTANSNLDLSNRIVFQPDLAGTITLTHGPLVITKNLEIDGPGQDVLTVSGNHQSGVFNITNDPRAQDVRFFDLTVADGTGIINPFSGAPEGGGIRNAHASLTLTRVTVMGNTVSGNNSVFGGGIYNATGTLTLNASSVTNNREEAAHGFGEGGGIYSIGLGADVTLTDSLVDGNVGDSEAAIDCEGSTLTLLRSTISNNAIGPNLIGALSGFFADTLVMTDSTMTNNSAPHGSTAFVGTATVTDSLIANNVGTGIVVSGSGAMHVFSGSTITGNTSTGLTGRGGGIVSEGDTEITNCTISGNDGAAGGGGIYVFDGWLQVTSSTITGNVVDGSLAQGGGGILIDASRDHRVLLRNTIVAGNVSATTGPDVQGDVFSFGYNLIGQRDDSTGWQGTDLTGTSMNPIDPQLGPLQDNGGPTPTQAILAGSPAISAGDPTLAGTLDQRGAHRYVLFPTIGAVGVVPANHFRVSAPAEVVAGQPFTFTVAAIDDQGFLATNYTGQIHFSSTDVEAQLPDDYTFQPADGGIQTFTATLSTPGSQTVLVYDTGYTKATGTATITVDDSAGPAPSQSAGRDVAVALAVALNDFDQALAVGAAVTADRITAVAMLAGRASESQELADVTVGSELAHSLDTGLLADHGW
jgi:putative cofactor-binding repeat protein